ncbi:MAG: hypothetical protein NTW86_16185 [Candidatus Sumerlaeota bacterium]|nr:hypothetical protein [Candidatus Sumerlaeota bacterium]
MPKWIWILMTAQMASPAGVAESAPAKKNELSPLERGNLIVQCTQPLVHPRGARMPLYVWHAAGIGDADDATAEKLIRDLDARGIALVARWLPDPKQRDAALAEALRIGRLQQRLGLAISVDANKCFYSFCDGSPETAHVDANGERFFDTSFSPTRKIGCPFELEGQWPRIRGQFEFYCQSYAKEGLKVYRAFGDWEIDGPIEWNDAWQNSKRCVRCRENIPHIDNFNAFQDALRKVRDTMQREVIAKTMKSHFPKVRVGNYAEYPNLGVRYWYDWFEKLPAGAPFLADHNAKHRRWDTHFADTGYTLGMPVLYTWSHIFDDYDFADTDYRWVYGMLKEASSACQARDEQFPGLPLLPFVHWTTTANPARPANPNLVPLSERAYREVLWHTLLRGADSLFLWCRADADEIRRELRPVHEVWAASLEYGDFLEKGKSVLFDVRSEPADTISARVLDGKVLVRRSHFGAAPAKPVEIAIQGKAISIPVFTDECRVLPFQ